MSKFVTRIGVVTLLGGLGFLGVALPQQTAQHTVRGQVLDDKNKPLPGVTIRVYRSLKKIAEDATINDGSYKVTFSRGDTISIRYDRTNWLPAFIPELSGTHSHDISKVLFEAGSRTLPVSVSVDTLNAFERVYYYDLANGIPRAEINKQYETNLNMLRVPPSLTWKHEFTKLYAVGGIPQYVADDAKRR